MAGGLRPPLSVIVTWNFNYDNPVTGGESVIIVTAVLLALVYCVVGMRLYARLRLVNNPGIDDALIIANIVPLTGMSVSLILAITNFGFNRHVWDNTSSELINARKITLVVEAFYMFSTAMTKISILLFYRRLAAGTVTRVYTAAIWAAITFVVAYLIVYFTLTFFTCKPFSAYWKQADYGWLATHGNSFKCMNEGIIVLTSAGISALQDFIACGLPMILFWKLRIPNRQKIALGGIFALGLFLCGCAVLRTIYVYRIYYTTYDMTWEGQPAWIWLSVEAHLAVICASAPALKIFFKQTVLSSISGYGRKRSSYFKHGKDNFGDSASTGPSEMEKGSRGYIGKLGTFDITVDNERFNDEHELVKYGYESKIYSPAGPKYDYRPSTMDGPWSRESYGNFGQQYGNRR